LDGTGERSSSRFELDLAGFGLELPDARAEPVTLSLGCAFAGAAGPSAALAAAPGPVLASGCSANAGF
jgi:hypothetical protein